VGLGLICPPQKGAIHVCQTVQKDPFVSDAKVFHNSGPSVCKGPDQSLYFSALGGLITPAVCPEVERTNGSWAPKIGGYAAFQGTIWIFWKIVGKSRGHPHPQNACENSWRLSLKFAHIFPSDLLDLGRGLFPFRRCFPQVSQAHQKMPI